MSPSESSRVILDLIPLAKMSISPFFLRPATAALLHALRPACINAMTVRWHLEVCTHLDRLKRNPSCICGWSGKGSPCIGNEAGVERKRSSHLACPREVPRRRDPTSRGQPRPEDCSWAVSCIEPESRPNLGLLVLGRASWLCSQSLERPGFFNDKNPRIFTNTQYCRIVLRFLSAILL